MTENTHPTASFWLDIIDKIIKLFAVLIGGVWTWWNYRKSRTYEQKLELEVGGEVYAAKVLCGDFKVSVKNIGATKHAVSHQGTFCTLSVIRQDLSEERIKLFKVFEANDKIEPGESISDAHCWRITHRSEDILWIKLALRVLSNGVEWFSTRLIHVEREDEKLRSEVK
jgi:hypothetical protein